MLHKPTKLTHTQRVIATYSLKTLRALRLIADKHNCYTHIDWILVGEYLNRNAPGSKSGDKPIPI
jgi:hypothetical protein